MRFLFYKLLLLCLVLSCALARKGLAGVANTSTEVTLVQSVNVDGGPLIAVASVKANGVLLTAGTVDFTIDDQYVVAVQISGNSPAAGFRTGEATLKRYLANGAHKLVASFVPYGEYAPSMSSPLMVTLQGSSSSAQLSLSLNPVDSQAVRFTLEDWMPSEANGELSLLNAANGSVLQSIQLSTAVPQILFEQTSTVQTGQQPIAIATGDFNGDGLTDVAAANMASGTVSIFLQKQTESSASFSLFETVSVGGSPSAIATADFNDDGLLDLAIVDAASGNVSIYRGDPDHPGQFVSLDAPLTAGSGASGIAVADFNSDGVLDIAVTNATQGTVTVFLASASDPGTFALTQTLEVSGGPFAIAAGDIFGSGLPDLAVTAFQSDQVWLLKNDPSNTGTFILPQSVQNVGAGPSAIVIADLNRDGIADLAVCDSLDDQVSVLIGDPSNRGTYPTERLIEVGSSPYSLLASQTGMNTAPNLVVANHDDGTVEILQNGEHGSFLTSTVISTGESTGQMALVEVGTLGSRGLIVLDTSADSLALVRQVSSVTGSFQDLQSEPGSPQQVHAIAHLSDSAVIDSNTLNLTSSSLMQQRIILTGPLSGFYGQPLSLTATSTSGLPVQLTLKSGNGTLSGDVLTPTSVGSIIVQADQVGSPEYSPAETISLSIQIAPAPLVITAISAQRAFGQPNPIFSGTISGISNGDDIEVSFESSATVLTPVGVYSTGLNAISPVLLDPMKHLGNYSVTVVDAPLTILAAASSIDKGSTIDTADSPVTGANSELPIIVTSGSSPNTPVSTNQNPPASEPETNQLPPSSTVTTSAGTGQPGAGSESGTLPSVPIIQGGSPVPVNQTGQNSLPNLGSSDPTSSAGSPITTGSGSDTPPVVLRPPTGIRPPTAAPIGSTFPLQFNLPLGGLLPHPTLLPLPIPIFAHGSAKKAQQTSVELKLSLQRKIVAGFQTAAVLEVSTPSQGDFQGLLYAFEAGHILTSSYVEEKKIALLWCILPAGSHVVKVGYAGDTLAPPSTSNSLMINVDGIDDTVEPASSVDHLSTEQLIADALFIPFQMGASEYKTSLHTTLPSVQVPPTDVQESADGVHSEPIEKLEQPALAVSLQISEPSIRTKALPSIISSKPAPNIRQLRTRNAKAKRHRGRNKNVRVQKSHKSTKIQQKPIPGR